VGGGVACQRISYQELFVREPVVARLDAGKRFCRKVSELGESVRTVLQIDVAADLSANVPGVRANPRGQMGERTGPERAQRRF
tara:strand:- start:11242 stop:11490 length:249 start_codon:yes stop_codon:yes gene_type:complete